MRRPPDIKRARGFLLIVAVLVLVVVAVAVLALGNMTSSDIRASVGHAQSEQAYYVGMSGLERATRTLLEPTLANRVPCASLSGDASVTNIAAGPGKFTVTAPSGAAVYPAIPATLNGNLSATAMIIPVDSIAGYSARGRIMIDTEAIDYSATSNAAATCGTAPCFVVALRGRAGTSASAHATGTRVGQFQCDVQSAGGVPDLVRPYAERVLNQGTQLQEAWAVGAQGAVAASRPWILRFQETTWTQVNTAAINVNAQLNAISMLSYADGFAVGAPGGVANRPFVMRWNGSAWTAVNTGLGINRALYGASCVSANDCWVVGAAGAAASQRPWIVRFNGAWSNFDSSSINVNAALRASYCFDANNCMAVGDPGPAAASRPFTVRFGLPGPTWSSVNNAAINQALQLFGVHCSATNDCWAVGQSGGVASRRPYTLRWNGAAWTEANNAAINVNRNLNSVYCNSASDCWAVGAAGAVAAQRPFVIRWNGVAWSLFNTGLNINAALNSVRCVNADDCWAVGNNDGAGELILKWNGVAWTRIGPSGAIDDRNLLAVQVIGAAQRAPALRREIHP